MRLESQQSTILLRVVGLLACVIACAMAIITGGAALLPALFLLALGGHYTWRPWVEAAVLSQHFRTLSITCSHLFTSSTRTFPLEEIVVLFQVQGGLRSAKYYVLEIQYQGRPIAELSPKDGFDQAGIEAFHTMLLTCQAVTGAASASVPQV